jgi:hypothetical protein
VTDVQGPRGRRSAPREYPCSPRDARPGATPPPSPYCPPYPFTLRYPPFTAERRGAGAPGLWACKAARRQDEVRPLRRPEADCGCGALLEARCPHSAGFGTVWLSDRHPA